MNNECKECELNKPSTREAAIYRMGYEDGIRAERERAKKTIEELLKVQEGGEK